DVLTLRSCIFVYLLTAVWLLGTLLMAVVPVPGLGGAPAGALVGVAFLRLGAMFAWRLLCEGLAVLFRISETLSDFEREEGLAAEWSFDKFMGLRFMLTPWLVRIIWFVGVPVIVVATLARPFGLAAFVGPTAGVGLCIGGVLGLRLLCELAIVIQRIYESSDGLRNHVRDEYAEGEARPDLLPAGPLFFRHMIAPGIIVAAWVLGSLAIIAAPVVAVTVGYPARALPVMVPLVLLALLVQRVTAEQSIVVFRIYQSLGEAATMVGEAADQKPQGAGAGFGDFLTFRWMLAPVLIQIDWIVGMVLYVAGIGVAAAAGFGMAEQLKQVLGDDLAGDVSGGGFALLAVLALTIILIQFRVGCEFAIVWFSINKVLTTFRRVLGSLLGVAETEEEARARGAARKTRRLTGAAAAGACVACALVLVSTGTAVSAAAGGAAGRPMRWQPRIGQEAPQRQAPAEAPEERLRPEPQAQPTRPAVQPPQFTWPAQPRQPQPRPAPPAPRPEPEPQPTEEAQEPEELTLTAEEKRQIDIAYRRALYFENRGDNRDACRIYRQLIERYPDVPELDTVRDRYNMHAAREIDQALVLGRGFERNNRPDLARKHYQEVLEVFPDVPGSEEVKARLEQLDEATEAAQDEEGG
ncbi:MAG: tetratricopeptide repeat protein, partial [Candidatus Brocadiia bacterium]